MMGWPGKDFAAWKEPLIWISGVVVVFILCLGVTFPYDALQARLFGELQRATGLEVHAAGWRTSFPLGLEWRELTVSKSNWPPIQMGTVRAHIGLLKALAGGVALDLTAHLNAQSPAQGTVTSTLTTSSWAFTGPLEITGTLHQVDLSKLVPQYVGRGSLSGDFTHRVDTLRSNTPPSFGEGTWRIDGKDLSVDQIPIGNGRTLSLTLNALSAGLACREQTCTVTELKAEGIDGSLSGEGTITIQLPLQQSQLALSLTVTPGAGFAEKATSLGIPPLPQGKPFSFKVQGTLAQARVAL